MDLFSAKIAYASSTNLTGFITNVDNNIINPLINFLFALAVIYFLYGVVEFLTHQDNEEKKTSGKSHMLWGIIGIAIMLGVWTILGVLVNTLGVSDQINPQNGTVNLH
jgi:uncharacterized membrane protein YidH (DUF202 family)